MGNNNQNVTLEPIVIINNDNDAHLKYKTPQQAILLDRDGVIIEEQTNYLRTEDSITFIPGVLEAIKTVSDRKIPIIVITNQSAVGRNIISLEQAIFLNKVIMQQIEDSGGHIDAIYMCYHHPSDNCGCRKPAPKMPLLAKEQMNLDFANSYFIGDTLNDMKTARAAGLKEVLVLTGHGANEYESLDGVNQKDYLVTNDLSQAIKKIFS